MKKLFCAAALLAASTFGHAADEGKSVPYTATVTGVVCGTCKAHITAAFKKLPGVEEVRFARGEKEGTQAVSFNAAASNLTKEDVAQTLGKEAAHYQVLAVEKNTR
jgi:copper chaperone CopZ